MQVSPTRIRKYDRRMLHEKVDLEKLRAALVGTRFARGLRHFASVDSTNALLLEAAANGAPEGTVYFADEQTAGRGRGGHTWHSTPGDGLYVSALVKPTLKLRDALLLSLATGVAAWNAIKETTGLQADLRWPNDLLLTRPDGTSRKCGGILVESAVEPGHDADLRYAVIGIGINVSHKSFPPELTSLATSLAIETTTSTTRLTILLAILRALDLELTPLEDGHDPSQLLDRFTQRSTWITGKHVHVPEQGGYTGVTAGLDARGFLRVASHDGIPRTVLSGGVRETK
jgi:BirA family biotin operon repressor/biotin-[acetyl-CoA-carboxylase] ligase